MRLTAHLQSDLCLEPPLQCKHRHAQFFKQPHVNIPPFPTHIYAYTLPQVCTTQKLVKNKAPAQQIGDRYRSAYMCN